MPYSTDTITISNLGNTYASYTRDVIDSSYTTSNPWTIEPSTFIDTGTQLVSPLETWLEKKIEEMVEKKLKERLGMKVYMLGLMNIGGDHDGD